MIFDVGTRRLWSSPHIGKTKKRVRATNKLMPGASLDLLDSQRRKAWNNRDLSSPVQTAV